MEATRLLYKRYPFGMAVATFGIIVGAGGIIYANYIYKVYIIDQYHNFPEPVAVKLRRALYYSNIDIQAQEAVRYYREALTLAAEHKMHPLSDEVLGVKIQLAHFLEKIQQFRKAIEVLEIVRGDCLRWVEEHGSQQGMAAERNRVLGKTVSMSVKLGELYADEHVLEPELAEENLVSAVETVLKEKNRREAEGVKEGEGPWMTDEEVGGAMEALANNYEAKDQHYLAAPLYLQALTLIPTSDCHAVILMNNLATSLSQQTPPSPTSPLYEPSTPPASRPALVSNARQWAQKALATAAVITPPHRTPECDVGCATATHNLGEFAEMDSDVREARRRYEEAGSLSRAIGYRDGERASNEGLRRLDGKEKGKGG
ncbi:MAG: hypothetical protein M1832_002608 [Thelocarpon impressellum]|nr:MAG: hypothetical protein M1832_002608 [Thelocarpon impressellum]